MAPETPSRMYYGGLLIVGSMAIIGLIDNFVLIIAEEGGLWQFHLFRSVIGSVALLAFCWLTGRSVMPRRTWAVALRSFLIAGAMVLYFGSLAIMPIAEAGAGMFMSPVFILVFSVLLLGRRVGRVRVFAVALGLTGALLVLRPNPENLDILSLFPLFAGMFYALGQIVTRHLCAAEDTGVVLLWFFLAIGTCGAVGTAVLSEVPVPESWLADAPFIFKGWVTPTQRFLFWTLVQAAGSLVAVFGLIRGYQVSDPTFVGVFEYSFLVFAGFWGWLLWNQVPDGLDVAGIAAIIAAGTLIVFRSRRAA